MATATVDGGDELRSATREREQRRERGPGREERGAGGAGHLRGASGGVGVEEAGRERATAIARASTRLCLLAEVEDDRLALVGWAFATVAGRR